MAEELGKSIEDRASVSRSKRALKAFAKILIGCFVLGSAQIAVAADDGARAYRLGPKDTQAAAVFGVFTRGNASVDTGTILADADIDVNLALPMYIKGISIGGQAATVGVILPAGEVKGQVQVGPTRLGAKDSGIGDLTVFAMVGLHNMPSLSLQDYVTHKAGVSVAGLLKVSTPTGSYSSARPLNLGGNRWVIQAALPMTFALTETNVDPKYGSIEIMPSVTFYTENDDVFGAAQRQTQSPLFMLEAHVTKNLSPKTFVSLDLLAIDGGKTKTDGISNNDVKRGLGLGGTIATMITPSIEFRATYGASVARNDTGLDTDMLRVGITKVF